MTALATGDVRRAEEERARDQLAAGELAGEERAEEELLDAALRDRMEIVDGELKEKIGMGLKAARVTNRLGGRMGAHVEREGLGEVMSESVTYRCFPHRQLQVRRPDLSFIAAGRVRDQDWEGHVATVPDLVVEVVSAHDAMNEVLGRVRDFLRAGTPLAWVVVPAHRVAYVYRGDGTITQIEADASLEGEGVLPGFACRLAELFAGLPEEEAASDSAREERAGG